MEWACARQQKYRAEGNQRCKKTKKIGLGALDNVIRIQGVKKGKWAYGAPTMIKLSANTFTYWVISKDKLKEN